MTSVSNDSKWYFWLDRWKDVFRHSTDEVTLNLVPRSVIINKTLATIMAILIHDCVYKETFSRTLISFQAWKPVQRGKIPRENSFWESLKVFEIILFLTIQTNRFANDACTNSYPTYRNGLISSKRLKSPFQWYIRFKIFACGISSK